MVRCWTPWDFDSRVGEKCNVGANDQGAELIKGLFYNLNRHAPSLFAPVRFASGAIARLMHAEAIANATNSATLTGQGVFHSTTLRPLKADDLEAFQSFTARQSGVQLAFFRPHKFDRAGLNHHLKSRQFLSFGLFEGGSMIGYGLIRITPTRAAYIGSMVAQSHSGRGVGKLLARYLYWQTAQMGLDAYLTISDDNPASLRSHSPEQYLRRTSMSAKQKPMVAAKP
jgi:hypothetical protein